MTSDATRFSNDKAQFSSEVLTRNSHGPEPRATLSRRKIGALLCSSCISSHRQSRIWGRFLKLAVPVLGIFIASFGNAQSAFTITTVNPALAENTTDLTSINNLITSALDTSIRSAPFTDFEFELDSIGKTKFSLTDSGTLELSLKVDESLDYEETRSIRFAIFARKLSTSTSTLGNNSLTITLSLTPVEERPEVLGDYANSADGESGRVFYIQREPDVGANPSVLASLVFHDPEGLPIALKPCADDFMVLEQNMDGTSDLASATETPNPRGLFNQDASNNSSATGSARHCPLATDTTNYVASRDVTRNGRVVNVTTQGSLIWITPVAADDAVVQRAVITFRGWAGSYEPDTGITDADYRQQYLRPGEDHGLR